MKPIRILHENVKMEAGGIETQLMRIYRNIDREKIQFDFLVHRTEKAAYDDEIKALGGKIYYAEPFNPFHHLKYVKSMDSFFQKYPEYKVVLVHADLALWPLKSAKKNNVPVRISYSHNGRGNFSLKRIFMDYQTLFLKRHCTDMFAVSDLAARYTFGDKVVDEGKVKLIKNGIVVEDFVFDEEVRDKKRKELSLEDKFIVGHTGRFMEQKNHRFLLDIFKCFLDKREDAHLILIGEGRLESEIRAKISRLGIEENVTLLGRRNDVDELVQAMDVFLLPSLYEGFPNVAIEAQASGLHTYMSDSITKEADFSEYSHMLSLQLGAEKWAEKIYEDTKVNIDRKNMAETMKESGYDVKATAKWYENFYLEIYNKLKEEL